MMRATKEAMRIVNRREVTFEFPATLCMTPYLDGTATVDELSMPARGIAGLTLRTYDPAKRQWSIYWLSSATGRLDPSADPSRCGTPGTFVTTTTPAGSRRSRTTTARGRRTGRPTSSAPIRTKPVAAAAPGVSHGSVPSAASFASMRARAAPLPVPPSAAR